MAPAVPMGIEKITFDLSRLAANGLVGPPHGLRSLSYEFCIPATAEALAEVQAIDPTVHFYPHSAGRIGCTSEQYLCIGNTRQPNWQQVLLGIAQLEYVERIDEFFGE
ncbi:MAG: hypothetical protein HC881_10895 [Leptolyngbyaceae cyanobacterium SL_7_1]|nr:hypothetical protein [Leptolyngbyaceae cyanobacterium SL_7_1]